MKKIKWSKKEKVLLNRIETLNDSDFEFLIKKFKIKIKIGPKPFDSDEKLLGSIGLLTEISYRNIIKELKKLGH